MRHRVAVTEDRALDAVLESEQRAGSEDQERHDVAEHRLRGDDEQHRTEQTADSRDGQHTTKTVPVVGKCITLRHCATEVPGTQRHGVGDVGGDRRESGGQERGVAHDRREAADA